LTSSFAVFMKTERACWALVVVAGCSGTAGPQGNELPVAGATVPTASVRAAASAGSQSAADKDEARPSLRSPEGRRAALAEVATACAAAPSQRPGPCSELCDLDRSPCTDKLETLELLARSAEPAVRVDAIDVASEAVGLCDCGEPHEQLSCLPKANLCQRLEWFAEVRVDAQQTTPRELQGRVLETIQRRMPDPKLAVPALGRLLKDTALAASPPTARDAMLAHRALVVLWRYGTTAQPARGELYAIIAAKPSPRLVADALVGLAAGEHLQVLGIPPTKSRTPSDSRLVATLEAALRDGDHLVQSAAALALEALQLGFVDIGKAEPRLAAWRKKADARAAAAVRSGPVQALAPVMATGSSAPQFSLQGPFLHASLAVGAVVSVLPPQPGPAEAFAVTSIERVAMAPGLYSREVVLEPVSGRSPQTGTPFPYPLAVSPPAPTAQSMDIDSVDPALLPAGVSRDGLTALGDIDGDGKPDVALNNCCGGVVWVDPNSESHPDSKSMYGCMTNIGYWLRDSLGWHRVYLLLPM